MLHAQNPQIYTTLFLTAEQKTQNSFLYNKKKHYTKLAIECDDTTQLRIQFNTKTIYQPEHSETRFISVYFPNLII